MRVRNVDRAAFPEPDNVARGRPVRASMALPTGPAAYVTDGHRIAFWSSLYQPQWVEIDLGHQYAIKSVALVIAQTPEGLTDHVILGRATAFERWRGLSLRGTTHDRELLTATARTAWRNVRYVRIGDARQPLVGRVEGDRGLQSLTRAPATRVTGARRSKYRTAASPSARVPA